MSNIKKLYLGNDELVDFSLYALTANSVTPATLASTLSGYVTTASQATTLSNYVTTTALNTALTGYATTASLSNYATTAALNAAIAGIVKLTIQTVAVLPATGTANILYLVPRTGGSGTNVKDEWLWVDGKWELIGTTAVDLSGYVTTSALTTALAPYVTATGLNTTLTAYAKTTEVTSAIATAKSETLAAAASDAQTKANSALAAAKTDAQSKADSALQSAKTYSDGKFATGQVLTQAAYDALPSKSPNGFYAIQ